MFCKLLAFFAIVATVFGAPSPAPAPSPTGVISYSAHVPLSYEYRYPALATNLYNNLGYAYAPSAYNYYQAPLAYTY